MSERHGVSGAAPKRAVLIGVGVGMSTPVLGSAVMSTVEASRSEAENHVQGRMPQNRNSG